MNYLWHSCSFLHSIPLFSTIDPFLVSPIAPHYPPYFSSDRSFLAICKSSILIFSLVLTFHHFILCLPTIRCLNINILLFLLNVFLPCLQLHNFSYQSISCFSTIFLSFLLFTPFHRLTFPPPPPSTLLPFTSIIVMTILHWYGCVYSPFDHTINFFVLFLFQLFLLFVFIFLLY